MSLLGNNITVRLQQNSSGVTSKVVAESTSVDMQCNAEALEATAQADALVSKFEGGKNTIQVSGDYLLADDAEQFENLFAHKNAGEKIEVDIYRSDTLVLSTEGVFTSLNTTGGLSDALATGAYSMELDALTTSTTTAYSYNGSDQHSYVADNGALGVAAASTDYCLVGWFKANAGATFYGFGKMSSGSIEGRTGWIQLSDVITFFFQTSTGAVSISSGINGGSDTNMHHFAARIDLSGSKVYIYVDGVLINAGGTAFTGTIAALDNAFDFVIGAGNDTDGGDFAGWMETYIRDVRVYHKDITGSLTELQNGDALGDEIGWWKLGSFGVTDEMGTYDLTNVNSPIVVYL